MGISTDGQICFGFLFDDEYEFPWDVDDDLEGDEEQWWRKVNGYKNPYEDPWDDTLMTFVQGPGYDAYFKYSREWTEANPLLFATVNVCSADYPIYILAVPGTVQIANRGFPQMLNPGKLWCETDAVAKLVAFCKEHGIKTTGEPQWWLSSCLS